MGVQIAAMAAVLAACGDDGSLLRLTHATFDPASGPPQVAPALRARREFRTMWPAG